MSILSALVGSDSDRLIKKLRPLVDDINKLESNIEKLDNQELADQTKKFRVRLEAGESLDAILPEAFATVREVARRVLGQRHFDSQLLGGIVLHRGMIAEMRTGEGKTLVATLPAYLNALSGKGVHLITVNDYLARRDAVWMGQIYSFLGLSVGVLNSQVSYLYDAEVKNSEDSKTDELRDEEGSFRIVYDYLRSCTRAEAYLADIVYGTNNEYGFDYLRDNLAYGVSGLVQRADRASRHNFAIVDEVDSILIDEARTPLIISAPAGESENLYVSFSDIANKLDLDTDYTVDEKMRAISLTDEGITKAEKILGIDNIYTDKGIKYVHHLETAVRAKALFERDRHYVVRNGEIVIVDEFTGRLQSGRRWSEGLHQAIEAKEGVKIQEESRTFATVTLQNYFRLYAKLAGMTGTAQTSAEEFLKVYGLNVVSVPTNKKPQRLDLPDQIFQTEKGKFQAVVNKVRELYEKGQPVLIGTSSIDKNELLSAYFNKEGLPHKVLNAKNHEEEGAIIASAGTKGAIVIATNMAGRGVDIKLGGPKSTPEEAEEVRNLGGLFVLGTERHDARRIDNQLRGRSGRQGDPGATQFFVSLEDDLMRIFGSDRIKNMMGRFGIPEDQPIENSLVSKALENAQTKIEGLNFDMRKHLLEYDEVVNYQRQTIYDRREVIVLGNLPEINNFIETSLKAVSLEPEDLSRLEKEIKDKQVSLGEEDFVRLARQVILQVIDLHWVEHLEMIDYMRGSVRLRAYGQRDPLVEFKREGLRLFKEMELAIWEESLGFLSILASEPKVEELKLQEVHDSAILARSGGDQATNGLVSNKVGRNDPCPCGSGKKYKRCCGA